MNVIRTAAILACAVLLAGCLPVTSKTPVGTTASLGADKALIGTWKGHGVDSEDKQEGFFHFMLAKDGSLAIAQVFATGGNDDGWTVYRATTAALGKNHFLNVSLIADGGGPADDSSKNKIFPLIYSIKGQTLTVSLLDEDKAKAAITAGKLKGTIDPGVSGDVQLTSDGAELDAFMATPEAAGLFKVLLVLKRVD
jgi:hypothetical protein